MMDMYKPTSILFGTLLLFFFFSHSAVAQMPEVIEARSMMSKGNQTAFEIRFVDIDEDMIEDMWEDYTEEKLDGKLRKNDDEEFYMEDIEAGELLSHKFNLYSKIINNGSQISLTTWFDLGDNFVSTQLDAQASRQVQTFLSNFYIMVRRSKITGMIKLEKERIEDLNDEIEDLKDARADLQRDIEKYKERIKSAEQKISENENTQGELQRKLQNQNNTLIDLQKQLEAIGQE